MLTPEEKNKLEELKNKEKSYIPLSDKDIQDMQNLAQTAYEKFHNSFMACQPFWNEMCNFISLLGKHNTKLLMEIEFLKTQLKKKV